MSIRENYENREIALIDILDTVLDKGVAIKGDIIISIAGIDLVYLDLKLLISSVETLIQSQQKDLVDSLSSAKLDREKEALERVTEKY
ncbi:Gas vesicle protein [Halobacillus karajensis]|uniref:Gas vesicle synthesis protein GvpA n=1 Tax=Halobacillus karajensis TaxID=195088 RepID=A0A024P330_9BACI|nr:gas vesicle protein [Halobacillus karajensis]CDQ19172.1 gas vesicle synthesis protein GvpA [Halobacillus karajensis]CDQ22754.1 gas vesicle synthesis protein GvpA [Halobacillus karajensis]CDQ26236.1 gas vesicle synthesis protein GvpA [Halobacillus karajensis]SEH40569.1 Gas vesicle protein [Halobacillus karajensis]